MKACNGVILPHEHLIHRISLFSGNPDNICVDGKLVAGELGVFRDAGGYAICDVTPLNMGRDLKALVDIERMSGVKVVLGVGLYVLNTLTDKQRGLNASGLADLLVEEVKNQSLCLPVCILGEIATHNEPEHADWIPAGVYPAL